MANKNFIVKNGLDVSGTANLSTLNLTGSLTGPASFTIDPAAVGDNTGTVIIAGNLQVDGTQTTINSATMTVDDLNITLASGAANAAAANGAGLTVDGASATLLYASSGDKFVFNKPLDVTGTVTSTTGFTTAANTRVQASSGMLFLNGPSAIPFEVGAGSEKMRLTSTGLGIGTASPSTKLTVKNDSATTSFGGNNIITIQNANTTDNSRMGLAFTGNTSIGSGLALVEAQSYDQSYGKTSLNFSVYSGSWHNDMMVLKEGKVGIGTNNPSKALSVKAESGSDGGIDVFHNNGNKVAELVHHGSGDEGRLSLYDGGSETVRIHGESGQNTFINSGNVGIGVTNPSSGKLQVDNASGTTMYISNSNPSAAGDIVHIRDNEGATGTNSFGGIKFSSSPGHDPHIGKRNAGSTGFFAIKNSSATEVFTIDLAVGKVGIGETNPTMGLHVADTKGALFGPTTGASMYVSPDHENTLNGGYGINTDTGDLWVNYRGYQNGTSKFRDFRVGNGKEGLIAFFGGSTNRVGIGTASPAHPLHITKELAGYQAYFNNDNGSAQGIKVRIKSNDSGNFNMLELVSASTGSDVTAMVVRDDGNVGIGTSDPQEKLHVTGSIKIANTNSRLYFGTSGSTSRRALEGNTSGSLLQVGEGYTDIALQGNVGIGTTAPTTPLAVIANSGANAISVRARPADDYAFMQFFNNAGTALRGQIYSHSNSIGFTTGTDSSAGNDLYIKDGVGVGIGTTTPVHKLDVRDGTIFAGRLVSDEGSISYTNTAAAFSSRGVDHDAARSNVLRLLRDGTSGVQYAGVADFDLESWETSGVHSRTAMILKLGHGNLPDSTDVMTWRSNGNVGIGNTNPSSALEVGNASSTYVTIRNASSGDVSSGYNIMSGSTITTSLYGNADEGWTTLMSGGSLGFRVNNASSGFNPMNIDTSGNITAPSQPDFLVQRSSSGGSYNPFTYSHSVPYNEELHDIGGNFDTSTGLFTAPVAGTYLFQGSIYSTSTASGGWVQAWLTINGARGNYTDVAGNGMNHASIICTTHMVRLAAGDTVGYHPYAANATYGFYSNVHHTWFKGRLLG